ncbi:hypothetical protein Patl1_32152 [Pistacia atlantica]|uniref:Uncharacterized protein n=1 Tax=Pistacia atlantica TaxID=434234 RepID=A0ACC1AMB9_9ROSI|nr:hypothetical protein Patl1_32152 [Pistacia atlantica]
MEFDSFRIFLESHSQRKIPKYRAFGEPTWVQCCMFALNVVMFSHSTFLSFFKMTTIYHHWIWSM